MESVKEKGKMERSFKKFFCYFSEKHILEEKWQMHF